MALAVSSQSEVYADVLRAEAHNITLGLVNEYRAAFKAAYELPSYIASALSVAQIVALRLAWPDPISAVQWTGWRGELHRLTPREITQINRYHASGWSYQSLLHLRSLIGKPKLPVGWESLDPAVALGAATLGMGRNEALRLHRDGNLTVDQIQALLALHAP